MNDLSILTVKDVNDIKKINTNIKYVNLNTSKQDVINYFINSGSAYFYAYSDKFLKGYSYVSFDAFKKGETQINSLIKSIPHNLNELEIVRYLYVQVGKMVGMDINSSLDKNEVVAFNGISSNDNFWYAMTNNKGSNYALVLIISYVLNRINISNEIIKDNNVFVNLVMIDDGTQKRQLKVNLFSDLPYVQGGFQTRFFDNYNNMRDSDIKIGYINDDYNDILIDKKMRESKINSVFDILLYLEDFIPVANMGSMELNILLKEIIEKYYNGKYLLTNLYNYSIYGNKEHFVLISDDKKCYSYNYKSNNFMIVKENEIRKNILDNKIGYYLGEALPFTLDNEEC